MEKDEIEKFTLFLFKETFFKTFLHALPNYSMGKRKKPHSIAYICNKKNPHTRLLKH